MAFDPSFVTWSEMGVIGSLAGMVGVAIAGFVMRQISNMGKILIDQHKAIEAHRLEVAKYYATTKAVEEMERRLTETFDRLVGQISKDMGTIASRVEALFLTILDRSSPKD